MTGFIRYYNPVDGRWISRDPIGENGGINLYGMVGNDAVGFIDINGLRSLPAKDFACCTKEKLDAGEKELNERYQRAVNAAKSLGLRPAIPGCNGASCKSSSADIMEYLAPTPECWVCNLEGRSKNSGADHQVIICKGYDPGPSKAREIMFDWWGDTDWFGNTNRQTRDPSGFRTKYPNPDFNGPHYPYTTPSGQPSSPSIPNTGFPNSTSPLPGSN